MSEQPDYVLACDKIGTVMYPDNKVIGLEIIDPAGQRAFISLRGGALAELGKQIQDLVGQHPEILEWPAMALGGEQGANPPA